MKRRAFMSFLSKALAVLPVVGVAKESKEPVDVTVKLGDYVKDFERHGKIQPMPKPRSCVRSIIDSHESQG